MDYKLSVKTRVTAAQIEAIYSDLQRLFEAAGIKVAIKLAVASDTQKQTAAARAARAAAKR